MFSVMLLMITGGIGLAQAITDPRRVALPWLRLGGIIAVTLLAVALVIPVLIIGDGEFQARWLEGLLPGHGLLMIVALALTSAAIVGQLLAVQMAMLRSQRIAAAISFVASAFLVWAYLLQHAGQVVALLNSGHMPGGFASVFVGSAVGTAVSAGLVGGALMTMLLGHAYLVVGREMTQMPFLRLARMLAALLLLRLISSIACLGPYLGTEGMLEHVFSAWNMAMITSRFFVGLLVPAVFVWMTHDCIRRRSNQSATGILYVTLVMVVVGEGTALALLGATGTFF